MAQLSNRIQTIASGKSGWELFYLAREMIDSGIDVIQLTIGEHDTRTDPSIIDAMHKAGLEGHTGYSNLQGYESLRDALAHRIENATNVKTTRDNLVITPGGQAALFAAHMSAGDPGDTALFIDPYYATYPGTIRAAGLIPQAVEVSASRGFQPTAPEIAPHAPGAKSLLINSPNNPTGAVYSPDTNNMIAQICCDEDLWLISDEVYDTQIWSGHHVSPRALPNMAERTMVVGSMSKSHAMTGSRVGWVCAPEHVIAKMLTLVTHTTYGIPDFIQRAALEALNKGPEFEDLIAAPFRRRRQIALDLLEDQTVIGAVPPDGAMYLMLDIRKTGLSGNDFARALLEQHHIAVMPGESFGKAAAGHIRIAMTVNDESFKAALTQIMSFAQGLVS